MFTNTDIIGKSWMVIEITNSVLQKEDLVVDKIFLIGSYATNKQTEWSDLDFLIQLKGNKVVGRIYPSWEQIQTIQDKLSPRIHCIFGTEEAQKRLNKPYREIKGVPNANTRSTILS